MARMNTLKWQSRLQVGDVKQYLKDKGHWHLFPPPAGASWSPKEAREREKRKCAVDDGTVKDGIDAHASTVRLIFSVYCIFL